MEFYDRQTGERFVPRGANYHRWVSRPSPDQGNIAIDSLFNTAFGQLDQAEAELQAMAAQGFNTVRVWKNACWGGVGGCIGSPAGGLSGDYLDNITEFLHMAKRHGIYVLFTDDWIPDDRRRMMEDGWLYWIEQLRGSILAIDPTALVSMGFFVQQEPHPVREGDTRLVYLERLVRESTLDFIDFHAYPGYDLSIRQHAENLAMVGAGDRLILMGEFGAAKENFPTAERAAAVLQAWQAASCEFGFDGWLMWTWGGDPGSEFWHASDSGGVVGSALSPAHRPDACDFGPPVPGFENLALLRPGTGEAYQLLHEFQQPVQHRVPLEFSLPQPMDGVRFVRVETPPGLRRGAQES